MLTNAATEISTRYKTEIDGGNAFMELKSLIKELGVGMK